MAEIKISHKDHPSFYVKCIGSYTKNGVTIHTMELSYPRFIHAELMTHRMFSRNASSSRAVPVDKILRGIADEPAMPIHWGKNQPGMQADEELEVRIEDPFGCTGHDGKVFEYRRETYWKAAAKDASLYAKSLSDAGYHKQIVNRLTEPFQYIKVVVTATEWDNFFDLRLHKDAQPEIRVLAEMIRDVQDRAFITTLADAEDGGWYLPYITYDELSTHPVKDLIRASVGRLARVSYLNHDKSNPDIKKDIELHNTLYKAGHMSPFEHVALVSNRVANTKGWLSGETHRDRNGTRWSGNFRSPFLQYRQILQHSITDSSDSKEDIA